MADNKQPVKERRGQTSKVVDHMLVERNQLLALLLQASNINGDKPAETDLDLLNEFCQVLVDYIAAGHFGLYERIINKTERRKRVANLAMNVYPTIEETTQAVLSFNERYEPDKGLNDFTHLQQDLSELGEVLANRIELEDQLINQLFKPSEKRTVRSEG